MSLHARFTCVCRKTKFPPVSEILSVKVWVFWILLEMGGCFDIAFLKSEGAIDKTNCIKRFIAISTTKIQKEFSFRILLVEIWQIYWKAHFSLFPLCLAAIFLYSPSRPLRNPAWFHKMGLKLRPIDKTLCWLPQGARRRVQKVFSNFIENIQSAPMMPARS